MPKATIDGREAEFEDGLTIIRAAERLGIEVPHYCWHPGLTIAGNCRMCLVEIEKVPKLQIACNTRVTEGMVVHTANERVKRAQESVLEFLLINHPIDCPICDQAGECKLQDYYMDFDRKPSRMPVEQKVHKRKVVDLGPRVVLDQERCILCLRCTRFLDEVPMTSELGVFERGDRAYIALAPGKRLENPYSENVVDICPVGALTSKAFRFQARVWYLQATESVCTRCSRGCNIEIHHREGEIYRYRPRYNPEVNDYWMCDWGRDTFRAFRRPSRLLRPEIRVDDQMRPAEWSEMLSAVARPLVALREAGGGEAIGIIVSASATNEEASLAVRLAAALGTKRIAGHATRPKDAPPGDGLLLEDDKNANSRGLEALGIGVSAEAVGALLDEARAGRLRALLVFGADLVGDLGRETVEPALEGLELCVVFGFTRTETMLYGDRILPIATPAETDGTITNSRGRVQRLRAAFVPPGAAREGWRVLADLLAATGSETEATSAAAVFATLGQLAPAFARLSWHDLGSRGAMLGSPSDSASSTTSS